MHKPPAFIRDTPIAGGLLETALKVTKLTRRFGSRAAVNELDLIVHIGDIFGFLGPNGAGKTTAIRCILGLIPKDSGTVELLGSTDPVRGREHVGAIVETPAFYEWMTGRANLQQAGWVIGLSGKALEVEIDRVLSRVGLRERGKDRAGTYSLGMKQRLGIARALLGSPKMLFLDEPTNGLDPAGMRDVRELVRSLAMHDQITIFMSSHLLAEIQSVCNRVAIIQDGELRAQGSVDELLQTIGDPIYQVDSRERSALKAAIRNHPQVVLLDESGSFRIQTPMSGDELNQWAFDEGVVLSEINKHTRNLEDVFMEAVT